MLACPTTWYPPPPAAYRFQEDKDNYIDICIPGSKAAARLVSGIEIPHGNATADPVGQYKGLYNPGGPGNNPTPGECSSIDPAAR